MHNLHRVLTKQLGKDTFEQLCYLEDSCKVFNNLIVRYAAQDRQDVDFWNLTRYRYLFPLLEGVPDFLLRVILSDKNNTILYRPYDKYYLRYLASQAQQSRKGPLGNGFVLPGKVIADCQPSSMHQHVKDMFFPAAIPEGTWDTIEVSVLRPEKRAIVIWKEVLQDGN